MGLNRLGQKIAVVTGASSGVGRAIANLFAAEGARLVVCADLTPKARPGVDDEAHAATHELICQQHGDGKAVFVKTDVGIGRDVGNCVAKAVEIGGRLDMYEPHPPRSITKSSDHAWNYPLRLSDCDLDLAW